MRTHGRILSGKKGGIGLLTTSGLVLNQKQSVSGSTRAGTKPTLLGAWSSKSKKATSAEGSSTSPRSRAMTIQLAESLVSTYGTNQMDTTTPAFCEIDSAKRPHDVGCAVPTKASAGGRRLF